jgi:hypothetical protein
MQPHPGAEAAERAGEFGHARLQRSATPEAGAVFDVDAVGAGVLRHHQQFLNAGTNQRLGLAHHLTDRPADQVAAHRRNDAEGAAVVAALGNLQVGIVARGELDAAGRNQVLEGVVWLGQRAVHRLHHLVECMRPGHRKHLGMGLAHDVALGAEAAGDDDLAVFRQRLTDCLERFLHSGIDEAAGVDHHHVGIVVAADDAVAFGAQLGQNAFGIDRRLGAAERDEADSRRAGMFGFG